MKNAVKHYKNDRERYKACVEILAGTDFGIAVQKISEVSHRRTSTTFQGICEMFLSHDFVQFAEECPALNFPGLEKYRSE